MADKIAEMARRLAEQFDKDDPKEVCDAVMEDPTPETAAEPAIPETEAAPADPERLPCIVFHPQWVDLILQGKKTWELRWWHRRDPGIHAMQSAGRGLVALFRITGVHDVDMKNFHKFFRFHGVPRIEDVPGYSAGRLGLKAWTLSIVQVFAKPVHVPSTRTP